MSQAASQARAFYEEAASGGSAFTVLDHGNFLVFPVRGVEVVPFWSSRARVARVMVALAGLVAALGWLLLNDPQSFLVRGLLVVAAFLLLAALLTRWVKLSLHVAFAALTATTLSLLGSRVGYALLAVVPVMFWSRVALARHRVHELVLGLVLGVLTGVVLVRL